MAIEIVRFPIKIVIFHSCVSLPEGNPREQEMTETVVFLTDAAVPSSTFFRCRLERIALASPGRLEGWLSTWLGSSKCIQGHVSCLLEFRGASWWMYWKVTYLPQTSPNSKPWWVFRPWSCRNFWDPVVFMLLHRFLQHESLLEPWHDSNRTNGCGIVSEFGINKKSDDIYLLLWALHGFTRYHW